MVLPSGEMSKTSGSWPLWNLRTTAVRRQVHDADAVGGAISRRQLRLVDAGSGDRRSRQRDEELLAVARQAYAARPLADRDPLDDLRRLGIDDDDVAAGFVRDVQPHAGRGSGRCGRRGWRTSWRL